MKKQDRENWMEKIAPFSEFETPFIVLDLDVARERVMRLKDLLPRAEVYYAVKSNNDIKLLKTIDDLVAGYDIASLGEWRLLQGLGIAADRVLYSNPVKIPSHVSETHKAGVQYFAVDSIEEIKKLKENAPGSTVNLRLKTPDYGSKFPLSSKFGIGAEHALSYALRAEDAGLQVKGLTFHVGSQSENPEAWRVAIEMCGGLIEQLAGKGIAIEFMDLGGGLPGRYDDNASMITEIAGTINKALEQRIPDDIRIVIEPGRYISANTGMLVTSIIGSERRAGTDWLYLDMGVFQGLIEPLEIPGWKYPIFTEKTSSIGERPYTLTGPTCDAYDTLGTDYMLPSNLEVGERVYIGATGAYTLVYGSEFNGFGIPKAYYVERGKK